jgi:uncharacterized protein RhaS with RHS repeats
MMARYYEANLGRFLSSDPDAKSVRPEDPQSWNRYAYVRNNPINYIDPDGLKDARSAEDKEILEDSDVKEAIHDAWDQSKPEANPDNRQEVGFSVEESGPGQYSTTALQSQGDPVNIGLTITKDSAATVHTHPVGNNSVTNKQSGKPERHAERPGNADKKLAKNSKVPAYVVAKKRMYRVDPATRKVKKVLTGKDFKKYMKKGH